MDKNEFINKLLSDSGFRKSYIHPQKRTLPSALRWIYKLVWSKARNVISFAAFALCNGLIPVISVYTIYYITWIIGQKSITYEQVALNIIALVLAYVAVSVVANCIQNKTYTVYTNIRLDLTKRILAKYMFMEFGLFDSSDFLDDMGNWFRSLMGNAYGVEGIYHKIFDLSGKVVALVILSIIMCRVSIVVPLLVVGYFLLHHFTGKYMGNFELEYRKRLDSITRKSRTFIDKGVDFRYGKEIRIQKIKGKLFGKAKDLIERYTEQNKRLQKKKFLATLPNLLLLGVIFGVIIVLTIYKAYQGQFTTSDVILYMASAAVYVQLLEQVSSGVLYVRTEGVYIGEMIDLYEAVLEFDSQNPYHEIEPNFELEFQDVCFTYPNAGTTVIDHFCMKIHAGEKIALVGLNGAGKSTLVKLLLGLYEPTAGKILLNGKDLSLYSSEARYEFYATVFQNPEPLAMTIAENVACESEYDKSRLEEALKLAGIYEKVSKSSSYVDTNLLKVFDDEGMILSGGENQKLAIARAIYKKNAGFVILDEPTSAMDSLAERDFYLDVNCIFSEKAVLFISHRLASTKFCDRIILLDDGGASEVGTHEELLALKGKYFMLFETQSQGFKTHVEGGSAQ